MNWLAAMAQCRSARKISVPSQVHARVAAPNVSIAKINATVVEGPPTRLGTLDVDQVVARWRRDRFGSLSV